MDGSAHSDDAVVYRLIYRSRNRIPPEDRRRELGELFSAARSHNKKNGITGALLLSDDSFVQTLEGEQDVVQALLDRIRADTRHDELEILDTGLVDGRVFAPWAVLVRGRARQAARCRCPAAGSGPAPPPAPAPP